MYAVLLCSLVMIFFISKQFYKKKFKNLPPSPPRIPILGHLHLLKPAPHLALENLAKKYGPVMYLHFGTRPVLIVSSPSAVEQCFSKNDVIFANRPESLATNILGYNYTTLGFSSYGDHWRNLRRITNTHIFSFQSLHSSSFLRFEETRFLVKKLFQGDSWRKVNLKCLFYEFVYNVVMVMITGKRGEVMDDMFGPMKILDICDFVPLLRLIGYKGIEKNMVTLCKRRDRFLQSLIEEARENIVNSSSVDEQKTYIHELLSTHKTDPEFYTDDILKGLILPMFTAGTHTTAVMMEWTISLLLNHPDKLHKLKSEISKNIPNGKLLDESDLPNLPYLRCVINETLRLFPVGPLLVPHSTSEECTVDGFDVPKDTILLVNAWAIHRDPNVWVNPTNFVPERFEGNEGGMDGYKFIPFGMGRRACPGSGMAMRMMVLALGNLIQCFEWKRVGPELVDLDDVNDLILAKVKPLEALYKPSSSMISFLSHL